MVITLKYTHRDGTKREVEYDEDVKEIWENTQEITSIDLKPLSS
jgi:hypothetical protein